MLVYLIIYISLLFGGDVPYLFISVVSKPSTVPDRSTDRSRSSVISFRD